MRIRDQLALIRQALAANHQNADLLNAERAALLDRRNALAEPWLPAALGLARRFYLPGFEPGLEDLRAEATTNLYYAAELYDPDQGFTFQTYALTVVRRRLAGYRAQYIQPREYPLTDFIEQAVADDSTVPLGFGELEPYLEQLLPRWQHVLRKIFLERRKAVDVARELGVSPARVNQMKTKALEKLRRLVPNPTKGDEP